MRPKSANREPDRAIASIALPLGDSGDAGETRAGGL
jgi:hypothetical protein